MQTYNGSLRAKISCITRKDLNSGCVGIALCTNPALPIPAQDSQRQRTAHSSPVPLVCTSLSCDNSICSASSRMNYGWTLQPLNVVGIYVDRASLRFITPPAHVTGSVWIWKRLGEKNQGNLQSIKAKHPVSMPLFPCWQTNDWLLCAETH